MLLMCQVTGNSSCARVGVRFAGAGAGGGVSALALLVVSPFADRRLRLGGAERGVERESKREAGGVAPAGALLRDGSAWPPAEGAGCGPWTGGVPLSALAELPPAGVTPLGWPFFLGTG